MHVSGRPQACQVIRHADLLLRKRDMLPHESFHVDGECWTFATSRAVPLVSHTLSIASVPRMSGRLSGAASETTISVMTHCTPHALAHRRPHEPHATAAVSPHHGEASAVRSHGRRWVPLRKRRCMLSMVAPHRHTEATKDERHGDPHVKRNVTPHT